MRSTVEFTPPRVESAPSCLARVCSSDTRSRRRRTRSNYTVVVTSNGCTTQPSNTITVTVSPAPNATITTASTLTAGAAGTASVATAGTGASYAWTIANGTIDSGNGTRTINYTAGSAGATTVSISVSQPGCSDAKSATVKILPTISTVTPSTGAISGGTAVTIAGSGFQVGGAVTFGGTPATNVVRVSSTTITAKTPAHASGAVNVVVTNPDTLTATRNAAFTYGQQFDPNGDGVVDPADIFYLVNYLFTSGPSPKAVQPAPSGSVTLGDPIVRDGRTFIPVSVEGNAHAISLRVRGANVIAVRRVSDVKPIFENTPPVNDGGAWLASFGENAVSGVVAEIEVSAAAELELDPALTMLTDQSGTQKASVGNGRLRVVAPAGQAPSRRLGWAGGETPPLRPPRTAARRVTCALI